MVSPRRGSRFVALHVLFAVAIWCAARPAAAAQASGPVASSAHEAVPIWPEGVPGALSGGGAEVIEDGGRVSNVQVPTLTPYPAPDATRTGAAVIVCPGGSYRRLAFDHEGRAVAEWLNTLGVDAFILKYRLKEYGHPAPLRDVLRAVRLVRSQATTRRLDPARIGVLGFSAGGHLAASAGTLFDAPEGRTGAALDTVSARPDFLVLVYPVITLEAPYAHTGSRDSLVGPSPSTELVAHLSLDRQVTERTPPTFLVLGGNDATVPPENSAMFYLALHKAGVPAELHVYEQGTHGFGLAADKGPVAGWPRLCAEWLKARGVLTPR